MVKQKRKYNKKGGGRTINVPKVYNGSVPGPSFNGAVTIGQACDGGHCSIPITPTTDNMIHNALNSNTPGANVSYPGTNRLGNNSFDMPGIQAYDGTAINSGPFNLQCAGGRQNPFNYIMNPATGRRVSIYGKVGKRVLQNYVYSIQ
jgi:hypothetical protein